MAKKEKQLLTGVLEFEDDILMFCMPEEGYKVPARTRSTHNLWAEKLNVLRQGGQVYFWVPGTERKRYASKISLNVPDRTILGKSFQNTGKPLEEVLEADKPYLYTPGNFAESSSELGAVPIEQQHL